MKKTSIDSIINSALPYFVGGAVFYVVWKHTIGRTATVDEIKKNVSAAKVEYLTMTEAEKDAYALKQANLIGDILALRVFSSFRNNDDIVAILKYNHFCLARMGKMYEKPMRLSLSSFLVFSLSSADLVRISDELQILEDSDY